jgi:hypothetical protein
MIDTGMVNSAGHRAIVREEYMKHKSNKFMAAAALVAVFLPIASESAGNPAGEVSAGATAVARPGLEWDSNGKPVKLDFNFGDFKAWARKKGGWQIEGWIHHEGLVCGTYYVGVRFGAGNPGCDNVQWFSDPKIVSQREHCNSAGRLHQGGDIEFPFADRFAQITCAERIVRCTGNCKYSLGGEPQGTPSSRGSDLGDRPPAWSTP